MLIGTVLFPGKNTENDQLSLIYDLCGTPDEESWPQLKNLKLYQNFPPRHPIPRTLSAHLLKCGVRPLAIDLLDKLLTVSPHQRWSAEQALNHAYFFETEVPVLCREQHPNYNGNFFEFETKQRRRRDRERELRDERTRGQLVPASANKDNSRDYVKNRRKRSVKESYVISTTSS
jgi:serine/threonine protein kinase